MPMMNVQIRDHTHLMRQFDEGKVVVHPELDLKSDSTIPNWIESPPWCAHLLGALTIPNVPHVLCDPLLDLVGARGLMRVKEEGYHKD
jgi:hypothetical protein